MTMQASFSELEYATKKKVTRRDRFLDEIDKVTPWAALVAQIEPFYPRANALGMDIVKIGRFAQILGRKASKKYLSNGAAFPFSEMSE